jgi:hypothetical protein
VRLGLDLVFLALLSVAGERLLPVERIVVDVVLRVGGDHRALVGDHQRVDLGQRGIRGDEHAVQAGRDIDDAATRARIEAGLVAQLSQLEA